MPTQDEHNLRIILEAENRTEAVINRVMADLVKLRLAASKIQIGMTGGAGGSGGSGGGGGGGGSSTAAQRQAQAHMNKLLQQLQAHSLKMQQQQDQSDKIIQQLIVAHNQRVSQINLQHGARLGQIAAQSAARLTQIQQQHQNRQIQDGIRHQYRMIQVEESGQNRLEYQQRVHAGRMAEIQARHRSDMIQGMLGLNQGFGRGFFVFDLATFFGGLWSRIEGFIGNIKNAVVNLGQTIWHDLVLGLREAEKLFMSAAKIGLKFNEFKENTLMNLEVMTRSKKTAQEIYDYAFRLAIPAKYQVEEIVKAATALEAFGLKFHTYGKEAGAWLKTVITLSQGMSVDPEQTVRAVAGAMQGRYDTRQLARLGLGRATMEKYGVEYDARGHPKDTSQLMGAIRRSTEDRFPNLIERAATLYESRLDSALSFGRALLGKFTEGLFGSLSRTFEKVASLFERIMRAADPMSKSLVAAFSTPFNILGKLIERLADKLPEFAEWMSKAFTEEKIIKFMADLATGIETVYKDIEKLVNQASGGKGLTGIWEAFKKTAGDAINFVQDAWNGFMGGLAYLIEHKDEIWKAFTDGLTTARDLLVSISTNLAKIADQMLGLGGQIPMIPPAPAGKGGWGLPGWVPFQPVQGKAAGMPAGASPGVGAYGIGADSYAYDPAKSRGLYGQGVQNPFSPKDNPKENWAWSHQNTPGAAGSSAQAILRDHQKSVDDQKLAGGTIPANARLTPEQEAIMRDLLKQGVSRDRAYEMVKRVNLGGKAILPVPGGAFSFEGMQDAINAGAGKRQNDDARNAEIKARQDKYNKMFGGGKGKFVGPPDLTIGSVPALYDLPAGARITTPGYQGGDAGRISDIGIRASQSENIAEGQIGYMKEYYQSIRDPNVRDQQRVGMLPLLRQYAGMKGADVASKYKTARDMYGKAQAAKQSGNSEAYETYLTGSPGGEIIGYLKAVEEYNDALKAKFKAEKEVNDVIYDAQQARFKAVTEMRESYESMAKSEVDLLPESQRAQAAAQKLIPILTQEQQDINAQSQTVATNSKEYFDLRQKYYEKEKEILDLQNKATEDLVNQSYKLPHKQIGTMQKLIKLLPKSQRGAAAQRLIGPRIIQMFQAAQMESDPEKREEMLMGVLDELAVYQEDQKAADPFKGFFDRGAAAQRSFNLNNMNQRRFGRSFPGRNQNRNLGQMYNTGSGLQYAYPGGGGGSGMDQQNYNQLIFNLPTNATENDMVELIRQVLGAELSRQFGR